MRYGRVIDIFRVVLLMQARADGLSLDDIVDKFEVSRRTAERMRDAIRDSFPQIEELREPDGRKRWRLPPNSTARLADPTLDEISALNRASEIARKTGDITTADHLEILTDKLRASFTSQKRARLEPDISALLEADGVALRPGPREQISNDIMLALRQAIMAGVWIEADHKARSSGRLSRKAELGPLALLLGEGRQYLVAYSQWAKDIRLFALTGFEKITLTHRAFDHPNDFVLAKWLDQSFGVWQEELYDVVWRFTAEAAPEARNYLFHPSQVLSDTEDGGLIVSFRSGGLHEMCWHLFRWGGEVEIISPQILKDTMKELLEVAQAVYLRA